MARRWTPKRFTTMRRIRVAVCAAAVVIASTATFALTSRKSIALDINGETTTVTTYAMTVDRLLRDQGVDVKTHDQITTTSGSRLRNHDVVTVRSAYQTTITIDGQEVPFWTVATSADQLLGFFEANEHEAARITVNIDNVYSQLTGGLVINENGPVTVIADGKSSQAPDGKLPAASILDSKGIVLNKEDRVSVEKDGSQTILRVRRVTHGEETRTETVPFSTQTIIDPTLAPGQTVIRQEGSNGEIQRVFDVTYVDGVPESETLISETTTVIAIDQIIAVGPEEMDSPDDTSHGQANAGSNTQAQPETDAPSTQQPSDTTGGLGRIVRRAMTPGPDQAQAARRRHLPPAAPAAVRVATPATPEAIPADRRRAASGIRPWPKPRPTPPAPPRNTDGPAPSGTRWSGCGTTNPAGCGTRITPGPTPTASRRPCPVPRWGPAGRTTARCRSTGG